MFKNKTYLKKETKINTFENKSFWDESESDLMSKMFNGFSF